MARIAIDKWAGQIELEAAQAPRISVQNALADALQEFCTRSWFWREELPLIDLVASTSSYTPTPPEGAMLVSPERVEVSGERVLASREDELDLLLGSGWRTVESSSQKYYYIDVPGTIRLVYTPDTGVVGGLWVKARLKPLPTAVDVPDYLFNEESARRAIETGTKFYLFAQANTAWYNAAAAVAARQEFLLRTEEIRLWVERGGTDAIVIARRPSYGGIVWE